MFDKRLEKILEEQQKQLNMLTAIINNLVQDHGNQVSFNKTLMTVNSANNKRIEHMENFLSMLEKEAEDENDSDRIIN